MAKEYRRVLHWFRRDLRLTDNTALLEANSSGLEVVPVYVLSDWTGDHSWTGPKRQRFLCECLSSLSGNLEQALDLEVFQFKNFGRKICTGPFEFGEFLEVGGNERLAILGAASDQT